MPAALKAVRAIAFDLDGTIYFGEMLANGAAELVAMLQSRNIAVYFFTNNSTKSRASLIEKLVRLGLPAVCESIYTSVSVAASYLRRCGWTRVAVIGTSELRAELAAAGIDVLADAAAAEALLVGLDPSFDFEVRPVVLEHLPATCPIIACNRDMSYPVEGGQRKPGCGTIVRAVEAWTGRAAAVVVGKPGTFMLEALCADHGLLPDTVLVVGDSYESDIAMALAAGSPSVLIDSDRPDVNMTDTCRVGGLRQLHEMLVTALPPEWQGL